MRTRLARGRRGSEPIVLGVIVVVVAAVAVVGGLFATGVLNPSRGGLTQTNPPVFELWVNWSINYTGSTTGYFGSDQSWSANLTLTQLTPINDSLTLHNRDVLSANQIVSIDISPPFSLVGVDPAPPISVAANGTVTFAVLIMPPIYSCPNGGCSGLTFPHGVSGNITVAEGPPPPRPVVVVPSGTVWNLSAGNADGNETVGPISLAAGFSWTLSGAFTTSNGVMAAVMNSSQYAYMMGMSHCPGCLWNPPSYFWFTGPGTTSASISATVPGGYYYFVWVNTNLTSPTLVDVTSEIIATAIVVIAALPNVSLPLPAP